MAPSGPTPPASRPVEPIALGGFARLERFWNDHSETIFRAAYRITGNPADAEDVLQTVFLRLARRAGDGGGDSGGRGIEEAEAGGYLHRSAVNAALDVVRSRQRAGWVPLEPAAIGAGDRHLRQLRARSRARAEPTASCAPTCDWRSRACRRAPPRSSPCATSKACPIVRSPSLLGISQGLVAVLLHRTRARLRKELAALEGVVR